MSEQDTGERIVGSGTDPVLRALYDNDEMTGVEILNELREQGKKDAAAPSTVRQLMYLEELGFVEIKEENGKLTYRLRREII
jgi:Fe2+ or Zn2+ uptake regulation protein